MVRASGRDRRRFVAVVSRRSRVLAMGPLNSLPSNRLQQRLCYSGGLARPLPLSFGGLDRKEPMAKA